MPAATPALGANREDAPLAARACRACGGSDLAELMPERPVPLYCNVLWPSRTEAIDAPRGPLRLIQCRNCGHVYNQAFDPDRLDYSPAYENSLHHSPHFSQYAETLARRLVEAHGLRGKFVVDVGCGRGDFLALLCRLGGNRGRGYDRSCPADAASVANGLDVVFVREFFSSAQAVDPIDLLSCRQVLEHIADPAEFVAEIARSPAVTAATAIFFEVPNAAYTFEDEGIWDLIYEHCSYFNAGSLAALFERCGFEVVATSDLFSGQYLGIEAHLRENGGTGAPASRDMGAVGSFAARYRAKVDSWREDLARWTAEGERIVIWGAGSKGVTFLDTLAPLSIEFAVDLNPRKHGRFLPGSGAEVVAPEFLRAYRPDRVIVMNAVYLAEIGAMLAALGLRPAVVAA